ncbi:MAG: hypothetical protein ACI9J3_001553 [Parvicellaceae bacterium]|jgi:hypothetical protein
MKGYFIFALLILIGIQVKGGTVVYDTIYHPYYDGIQMVELKPVSNEKVKKAFLKTSSILSSATRISKYMLRNKKGNVVATYNDFDASLNWESLSNKKDKDKKLSPHKLKAKSTSIYSGNDNSGYNMLYPIYETTNNDPATQNRLRVGLMDSLGKIVFPPLFDEIQWIDSMFITKDSYGYSLYDHSFTKLLTDLEFIDYISTYSNHILVKNNGKEGLMHRNGKMILQVEYQNLRKSKYMHGHYEFEKDGLWGFIDFKLKRFLPPFSPSCSLFNVDNHFQYHFNGHWRLIDSLGNHMLASKAKVYQVISEERFLVYNYTRENGYERFLVNQDGIIITDRVYYSLWRINSSTLIAGYDTKKGFNDSRNPTKWKILNTNGIQKNTTIYKVLQPLGKNWLKSWDNRSRLNVLNDDGSDVLGYFINQIYRYNESLYLVTLDEKYFFTDLNRTWFRTQLYDKTGHVTENRIGVCKDGKWGFIHAQTYEEVFPITAQKISRFVDGIAKVMIDGKWMVIDSTGQFVTHQNYSITTTLKHGFTKVKKNGKFGIIDQDGDRVVPLVYDKMKFTTEHDGGYLIGVYKDGFWGVINEQNDVIIAFEFKNCLEISGSSSGAYTRRNGFYAIMITETRLNIKRYYINFDTKLIELKAVENHSKGFKICSRQSAADANRKCYGVRNFDGKIVIPYQYIYIKSFKQNTFRASTKNGIGLIDTAGNMLIPANYKRLNDLSGNQKFIVAINFNRMAGLFGYDGKQIADTVYSGFEKPIADLIPFYANMNRRYTKQDGWTHDKKQIGFMDFDGKIVVEPNFDSYSYRLATPNEIILRKGKRTLKVNLKGELIEGEWPKPSDEIIEEAVPKHKFSLNLKRKKKGKSKGKVRFL